MKNIVLCGFMGSGKTTVGRLLAEALGMEFTDTDALIERRAGMSVGDIFSRFGEERFRELEAEEAQKLALQGGMVVSTGGGTVLNAGSAQALRAGGVIVCLDVPAEVVSRRLAGDTSRPLLNVPDRERVLRALYEQRMPLYRAAAQVVVSVRSDMPAAFNAGLAAGAVYSSGLF
jgi:shikimate kinase